MCVSYQFGTCVSFCLVGVLRMCVYALSFCALGCLFFVSFVHEIEDVLFLSVSLVCIRMFVFVL